MKSTYTTLYEDEHGIDLEEYNASDFLMGMALTVIFLICFLV